MTRTPPEPSDPADHGTLYEQSTRGDRHALHSLVQDYLPRLHAFVRVRMNAELRNREDSLDLVQSICGDLVEHKDLFEFQGEPQFRGWLFTSALNKIREKHRFHGRDKRDIRREQPAAFTGSNDGGIAAGYADLCSPSQDAVGREQLLRIEAALDALPADAREVISLVRIAGLTSREAAEQMGKTPAAVRKLLSRALVRLAVSLGSPSAEP